jgi:hypothetical protein
MPFSFILSFFPFLFCLFILSFFLLFPCACRSYPSPNTSRDKEAWPSFPRQQSMASPRVGADGCGEQRLGSGWGRGLRGSAPAWLRRGGGRRVAMRIRAQERATTDGWGDGRWRRKVPPCGTGDELLVLPNIAYERSSAKSSGWL